MTRKKNEVVAKWHHPPVACIRVRRKSLWERVERFAGAEKTVEEVVRCFGAFGFLNDIGADSDQVSQAPWGILDSQAHESPSFERTSVMVRLSPRPNSASDSAIASRISAASTSENRDTKSSAMPAWIFRQSSRGMVATVSITSAAVIDRKMPANRDALKRQKGTAPAIADRGGFLRGGRFRAPSIWLTLR